MFRNPLYLVPAHVSMKIIRRLDRFGCCNHLVVPGRSSLSPFRYKDVLPTVKAHLISLGISVLSRGFWKDSSGCLAAVIHQNRPYSLLYRVRAV